MVAILQEKTSPAPQASLMSRLGMRAADIDYVPYLLRKIFIEL